MRRRKMLCQGYLCCRFFSRGFYSCRWTDPSDHPRKCRCLSFSAVTLMSLLFLCWLYVCAVMSNDQQKLNDGFFRILQLRVDVFMVVFVISAVIVGYCILLLLFALIQVALGEQLLLHWFHKIVFCLGVIFVTVFVSVISIKCKGQWQTIPTSLQATAPFLQLGAVGALTLLSPFVFQRFHLVKARSKVLIAVVFAAVSATIFLCPLLIKSPCIIRLEELPEKPKLIGHRGVPMLAPENTMMSFNRSLECGVMAFETDVQLSKERTPFLMHDDGRGFLLRTTNVKDKFPNGNFSNSTDLTLAQLQTLSAGEWFLKTDPYGTVSLLSEEEKERARNQTVPTLLELLQFAQQHNTPLMFDFKGDNQESDAADTVRTIFHQGIDPSLILWRPTAGRDFVKTHAPNFIQVYGDEAEREDDNGRYLNVEYNALTMDKIRDLRKQNVTVNLWVVNERWLFSLLWCAGASSVTTNVCPLLKEVDRPDWVMAPSTYMIIWISVDISTALIMFVLFHWTKHCLCHQESSENERELFLMTTRG